MNSDEEIKQHMAIVCTALTKHNVDFLIVGGYAVNVYGYKRPSTITSYKLELKTDFDFWYKPSLLNFEKLLKALVDLDVDTTELKKIVFDPKRTFLKIPHKHYHTDFLPSIAGLGTFADCKKNAMLTDIGGTSYPVIGYNDLILSKLAINRNIDREDIKALDKIRNENKGTKPDAEEKKVAYKKKKRRSPGR